jgi:ligand-binding sensor domain-containing protein
MKALEIHSSDILSAHSMVFGRNTDLWIGLDNGIINYNTRTGDYQFFTGENMDFEVKELTFLQDSERIWAASDGLPKNSILKILGDSAGNFWMSTYKGISEFNYQN